MTGSLKYDAAIEALRKPDARLVRLNNGRAPGGYFVTGVRGGGHVDDAVAAKIMKHPLVRGGKDGLFPGHDQTWRMLVDPRPEGDS
jgi:hypothetical protein